MPGVVEALRARVRRDGPQPLLTYYDLDRCERTELSALTFANWVDKTSQLLDELDVGPGEQLAVPVVRQRPGHWVGLIAAVAGWQLGAAVTTEPQPGAVVAVVGPDDPWAVIPPTWLTVVACSLHPLGAPLQPPAPVVDFAEVLAMPDAPVTKPHLPGDPAWGPMTYAELAGLPRSPQRTLVRADCGAAAVEALASTILGGGSLVVVAGTGEVAGIAAAERVASPVV